MAEQPMTIDSSRGSASRERVCSLENVVLRYENGVQAIEDISLEVFRGERIVVLGANGSGKSTLASVICGLLAPDTGKVELLGERVFDSSRERAVDFDAYRRAKRGLGLVFQNPDDQIVTTVVEEDIAFGPENLGVPSEEIGERVERELHRVALDKYAKADPTKLSGGQKQRVAIAGALAMEPEILVLDEPAALLDVRGRRAIMRVMGRLRDAGTTIVHITHFMEEALAADRVVVLDHGRVALTGTPEEVFAHAEELVELALEVPFPMQLAQRLRERGLDVPLTCDAEVLKRAILDAASREAAAELGDKPPCSDSPRLRSDDGADSRLSDLACGTRDESYHRAPNDVTGIPTPSLSEAAGSIITAEHVSYSYRDSDSRGDDTPALDDISFKIPRGSTTAIVGQTGSGKSTLLRLLCALEVPDAGRILIENTDTANPRNRRLLHGHIGYVMQHPERQLFAETVFEDVAYGPRNMGFTEEEVEKRAKRALSVVGLEGLDRISPFELSGGQQRLVAIAGILAMSPATIVLDEPTAGLDPRGRRELRSILRRVNDRGVTVIQVTHSMDEAARAQRIIILDEARISDMGTPFEVFTSEVKEHLEGIGLGLPSSLEWAYELEAANLYVGEPHTLDALADAIAGVLAAESEGVG